MGYIVGLNVGIVVVSGSILTWHIAIPIYQAFFMNTDPALAASVAAASSTEAAFAIWGAKMRYLGVGAMLIGGIWTLIRCASRCSTASRAASPRPARVAARCWRTPSATCR